MRYRSLNDTRSVLFCHGLFNSILGELLRTPFEWSAGAGQVMAGGPSHRLAVSVLESDGVRKFSDGRVRCADPPRRQQEARLTRQGVPGSALVNQR